VWRGVCSSLPAITHRLSIDYPSTTHDYPSPTHRLSHQAHMALDQHSSMTWEPSGEWRETNIVGEKWWQQRQACERRQRGVGSRHRRLCPSVRGRGWQCKARRCMRDSLSTIMTRLDAVVVGRALLGVLLCWVGEWVDLSSLTGGFSTSRAYLRPLVCPLGHQPY
jgi:hypothetical protein